MTIIEDNTPGRLELIADEIDVLARQRFEWDLYNNKFAINEPTLIFKKEVDRLDEVQYGFDYDVLEKGNGFIKISFLFGFRGIDYICFADYYLKSNALKYDPGHDHQLDFPDEENSYDAHLMVSISYPQ